MFCVRCSDVVEGCRGNAAGYCVDLGVSYNATDDVENT